MTSTTRKTELSPLEAIIVESALGEEARKNKRDGILACIQQLTKERQRLYARSAAHPILAPANGPRIRALTMEIDQLWETLRRQRANRRLEMERALNVVNEEEEGERSEQPIGAHHAIPSHTSGHTSGHNSIDAA